MTALPEGTHTLSELKAALSPVSEVVRRQEFMGITASALTKLGRKALSSDILDSVPSFVVSASNVWVSHSPEERTRILGFSPEFLPLIVDEAQTLEALYQRFVSQD